MWIHTNNICTVSGTRISDQLPASHVLLGDVAIFEASYFSRWHVKRVGECHWIGTNTFLHLSLPLSRISNLSSMSDTGLRSLQLEKKTWQDAKFPHRSDKQKSRILFNKERDCRMLQNCFSPPSTLRIGIECIGRNLPAMGRPEPHVIL